MENSRTELLEDLEEPIAAACSGDRPLLGTAIAVVIVALIP